VRFIVKKSKKESNAPDRIPEGLPTEGTEYLDTLDVQILKRPRQDS
jgi:hypothetical protein